MKSKLLISNQETKLLHFINSSNLRIMNISSFIYDGIFIKFLNKLMKHGKKNSVFSRFLESLVLIKNVTRISPLFILRCAVFNVKPLIQIKTIARGKNISYESSFCSVASQLQKSIFFIINSAVSLKSNTQLLFSQRLAIIILNCFFKQGDAYRSILKTHSLLRNRRYHFLRSNYSNQLIRIKRTKKMKGYYHQNRYSLFRKLSYSKFF
jgi:ribosomal protein S7